MTGWTTIERRWCEALFAAMLPPPPGGRLPPLAAVDLSEFWRVFHDRFPLLPRLGLRLSVWLLTSLALVLHRRPFHRLPPDAQDAFLVRLDGSRAYLVRQLVLVVKTMACFAYFLAPQPRRAVVGGRP